jgi:hypothetical protein
MPRQTVYFARFVKKHSTQIFLLSESIISVRDTNLSEFKVRENVRGNVSDGVQIEQSGIQIMGFFAQRPEKVE